MNHCRVGAMLCAIAASFACASLAGTNEWSIQGPPGGWFRFVQASSTAPNVFYAAYGRSLHKSSDGGTTWTTVRDVNGQVNGLAVDQSDGNRIYIGVYDEGILRSEDGGQNFSLVATAPSHIWGVGANATTVYYSAESRVVYRSTDRGQTWTPRAQAPQTLTRILVDPQNADSIYATAGAFVVVSADGGSTWSSVAVSGAATINDIAQLSATQLVVATNTGLHVSNDSGAHWTNAQAGAFSSVVADRMTAGRAVAASAVGGPLLVTTNFGATWSTLGTVPTGPGRLIGLGIDSQSSTRMVVLNEQGAQRTDDAAQTWSIASQSPIATAPRELATARGPAATVYAYTTGSGDGLFALRDDGGWDRLNLAAAHALNGGNPFGQARLAVWPDTPQTLLLGAFNIGVYRSLDGGASWLAPNGDLSGFAVQAFAFDPDDSNVVYAQVNKAVTTPATGLYRSTDAGATWAAYSTSLGPELFGMDLQIDPAAPTRMFLGVSQLPGPGASGGLYRSTDRGVHWSQIAFAGHEVRAIAIDPASSANMYVATTSGLQTSTNGGDTFAPNAQFATITNQPASSVVIDPIVTTTLYASSYDPGSIFVPQQSSYVLRSVDRGQSWEVLRSGAESSAWYGAQITLDPNNPAMLHVNTGARGVATLEIAPDLAVELTGHAGERSANVESTFALRVTNNGPYAATAVRLTTALPTQLAGVAATIDRGTCAAGNQLVCTIPVLRSGETASATVRYTPTSAMLIPIATSVAAHERDATIANNSAQATAFVGDVVDLSVGLTASATTVSRGGNVTYVANVTNSGPLAATAATLTLTIGAGFTLGGAPNGCNGNGSSIACPITALALGNSQSFTFTATATEVGTTTATATIATASSATDGSTANNVANVSVNSTAPPSSGGGGGGALGPFALLALLLVGMSRGTQRLD